MDWKAKISAAIIDLQAALTSRAMNETLSHLNDAQGNVMAAIDALDDARASEAT